MPRSERHDALILGGGLAGISAALSLRGFGLDVEIVEESLRPGGQIHEIHAPIRDYPMAHGLDGPRFAAQLLGEARAAELRFHVGARITAISARGRWVECPERLHARALGVPGEVELLGRGVSHSANRDRTLFSGRPVVIVGGGTAAVEDALLCADVGSEVTLIHRSTRFRARSDFLERARKHPRVRILSGARVEAILGKERVEGVRLRARGAASARRIRAAGVFVRIGWDPRTEYLRGQVALDRERYVKVKPGGATSAPGVWAAGDVCSPRCPTLANAAGQGAMVAWEIVRALGRMPD